MSDYDSRYGQSGPGSDPEQPAGEYAVPSEQESATEMTARYSVGDELRMQRESLGKSIADVVDSVRIQSRPSSLHIKRNNAMRRLLKRLLTRRTRRRQRSTVSGQIRPTRRLAAIFLRC